MTPELANSGSRPIFSNSNNFQKWLPSHIYCADKRSCANDFSRKLYLKCRAFSKGSSLSCMLYFLPIPMYLFEWVFDMLIGSPCWWCFAISLSICNDFAILLFNFECGFQSIINRTSNVKLTANKIQSKMKSNSMLENFLNLHFDNSEKMDESTVLCSFIS